jgi:hypothetical protein
LFTTTGAGWLRVKYESVNALDAMMPPTVAVLSASAAIPSGRNTLLEERLGFGG